MRHVHTKWIACIAFVILVSAVSAAVFFFWSAEKRAAFFCAFKDPGYERILCIKPYVEDITRSKSQYAAFSFIRTLQKNKTISDCHVPLHFVGEIHLEESDSLGEALATCPSGCFEGCQHGVVEGYLAEAGAIDVRHICQSVSENPLLFRQCLHGLGHGLLRHNNSVVEGALDACGLLENEQTATTCSDGVMMEYVDAQLYASHTQFLENFSTTCDRFRSNEHLFDDCMNNVGWGLMVATGHDLKRSLDFCLQFESRPEAELCGRYVQGELRQNREELKSIP